MDALFHECIMNRIKNQDTVRFVMKNGITTDLAKVEKMDQGVVFLNHIDPENYKGIILFDQIESILVSL